MKQKTQKSFAKILSNCAGKRAIFLKNVANDELAKMLPDDPKDEMQKR